MRKLRLTAFGLGVVWVVAACTKVLHQADVQVQSYTIHAGQVSSSDSSVSALIAPYKGALDADMNTVIGNCVRRLVKAQPEGTLGNWMVDAMHQKARTFFGMPIDIALQNYGGIRVPYLAEGAVTRGNIYELMPFENRLVLLQLKGKIVRQLLEHIVRLGGWPISQNVHIIVENGMITQIHLDGTPIDAEAVYSVVLPDYIANGGDNCNFLSDYVSRKDTELLIRDMLLEHLHTMPTIDAEVTGRIVFKE